MSNKINPNDPVVLEMWCCVGTGFKCGNYYDTSTLSYLRKWSIEKLVEGGYWPWRKWKSKGWKCVRVTVSINELNKEV